MVLTCFGSVTHPARLREAQPAQATIYVLWEETLVLPRPRCHADDQGALADSLDAEASAMLGDANGALDALERNEAAIEATKAPSARADRLLLRPRTAGRRARSVLRAPAPLR